MHNADHGKFRQMSSFELFLRTGRRVKSADEAIRISLKFNPWHDPHNGQFTTSGSGVRSSTGETVRHVTAKPTGTFRGGGGSFGGGGATGSWSSDRRQQTVRNPVSPPPRTPASVKPSKRPQPGTAPQPVAAKPLETHHTIERNGYKFEIDKDGRTRSASGQLRLESGGTRSRAAQSRAGGPDRKPADDGGHYIALRFGGPSIDNNHFAQDRNFNRGAYRTLEDKWARDLASGRRVSVKITPEFDGVSTRPVRIVVRWKIDGHPDFKIFPNTFGGK